VATRATVTTQRLTTRGACRDEACSPPPESWSPVKPISARSYAPYLTLMLCLAAVKLAIMAGPDSLRSPAQAAVFAWPFLGVLMVAGLVGLRLSRLVGIPKLLDERVPWRHRFLEPAVAGFVLGSALLASDLGFDWSRPMAVGHGLESIHIPFPASALIYPGGAIIVCVIYYLLPIPLLTWAISRGLLRGRHTVRSAAWPHSCSRSTTPPTWRRSSCSGGRASWPRSPCGSRCMACGTSFLPSWRGRSPGSGAARAVQASG
jgi:hypothetical protein